MTTELFEKEAWTTRVNVAVGKYLTFRLDQESYGIQVLKVREIISPPPITRLPKMPDYVKGVINLRGRVIPIIDLRTRFGMTLIEATSETCIVVVQLQREDSQSLSMGLVVDGVEEVINIGSEDIEPSPQFGTQVDTASILGMCKVKGQVKILLDIDRVICGKALEQVTETIDE